LRPFTGDYAFESTFILYRLYLQLFYFLWITFLLLPSTTCDSYANVSQGDSVINQFKSRCAVNAVAHAWFKTRQSQEKQTLGSERSVAYRKCQATYWTNCVGNVARSRHIRMIGCFFLALRQLT